MTQTLVDPSQLFLTGNVLETVYQWSNILKSFQQRLSPHVNLSVKKNTFRIHKYHDEKSCFHHRRK